MEQTSKENAKLKKELQFTKQKLQTVTEQKDRIDFDLEELEQYTCKNSLEIHGTPQEAYTTTEDVVLKIGEVLDVPISPGDIEISHQLKSQNKPIIVKFLSHKVKSSLYKKRTALKDITVSDLFPTSNYATSLGRGNRIFLKMKTSQPTDVVLSKKQMVWGKMDCSLVCGQLTVRFLLRLHLRDHQ